MLHRPTTTEKLTKQFSKLSTAADEKAQEISEAVANSATVKAAVTKVKENLYFRELQRMFSAAPATGEKAEKLAEMEYDLYNSLERGEAETQEVVITIR